MPASQPTLAAIPGILVRAIMRTLARLVLLLAQFTLTVTVALVAFSFLLATFRSARSPRQQIITDLVRDSIALILTYKADQ